MIAHSTLAFVIVVTLTLGFVMSISLPSAHATDMQVLIKRGSTLPKACNLAPCFIPDLVSIQKGDQVTWENLDNVTHRIVSGNSPQPDMYFDSGPITPGKKFTQFFYKTGTYDYFDLKYSWLKGSVKVEAATHAALFWNFDMLISGTNGTTTTPRVGLPLTITKYINNTGNASASNVSFEFDVYDSKGALAYRQFVTGSVDANKSAPISFQWVPTSPSYYDFVFTADSRQTVSQADTSGNLAIQPIVLNQYPEASESQTVHVVPEFGVLGLLALSISTGLCIAISKARLQLR